ncbi:Kinesin member [Perkinsus olseni]|uniref:Kinesin member n=1 Tax=Perkinsus olseni TaxID=32597 RepID=A0A7J6PKY4_PEROL|nr:Kinesin member [Perkinsus olseni]
MVIGHLLTMPMVVINMGGEMMYILNQRLVAQSIPSAKKRKVLSDVIRAMFEKSFMKEMLVPQEMYSMRSLRQLFERLVHSSIMRLNALSMDKLFDLVSMGLKLQTVRCGRSEEMVMVTMNHIDGMIQLVKDDEEAKISTFLQEGLQGSDASLRVDSTGVLPFGYARPGKLKEYRGNNVVREEVLDITGRSDWRGPQGVERVQWGVDREWFQLGTDMYSTAKDDSASEMERQEKEGAVQEPARTLAPEVASRVAKAELSVLANLIAAPSEQGAEQKFTLRLFEDTEICGPAEEVESSDEEIQEETETISASAATRSYRETLKGLEDDLDKALGVNNEPHAEDDDLLDLFSEVDVCIPGGLDRLVPAFMIGCLVGVVAVRTCVRVRPLLLAEVDAGCEPCVDVVSVGKDGEDGSAAFQLAVRQPGRDPSSPPELIRFHCCLGAKIVFERCGVRDMLHAVLEGYRAAVMAYGQTGSGKTHTMIGDPSSGDMGGLIHNCAKDLFRLIKELGNERNSFYVSGLRKVDCESAADVLTLVAEGTANRQVYGHELNRHSSRSHCLFSIFLSNGGKLTFADLAGSERLKVSRTEAQHRKETQSINKSLLALGKVINALSPAGRVKFVGASRRVPVGANRLSCCHSCAVQGQQANADTGRLFGRKRPRDDNLHREPGQEKLRRNCTCAPVCTQGDEHMILESMRSEVARLRAENLGFKSKNRALERMLGKVSGSSQASAAGSTSLPPICASAKEKRVRCSMVELRIPVLEQLWWERCETGVLKKSAVEVKLRPVVEKLLGDLERRRPAEWRCNFAAVALQIDSDGDITDAEPSAMEMNEGLLAASPGAGGQRSVMADITQISGGCGGAPLDSSSRGVSEERLSSTMSEDSLVDWRRGHDEGTADGEAPSMDDSARHRGMEAVADEEISGRESPRIEECALIQDSLDGILLGDSGLQIILFREKRTFIFKKATPLENTEKLRGKDPEEHWPPGNRAGDLQLPSKLNRKLSVYNSRHTCGRKRSTVLMITQGDRHKPILTLDREEFEGVMAAREEVEKEIVNFGKKLVLTLGILSTNHRQFSRCESSKDWRQEKRVSIYAMGSVGPELERARRGAQRLSFLPDERWARVTLGDGFGGAVTEDGKAWLWRKRSGNGKNGNSAAVVKPIPLPRGVRAVDIQSSKTALWLLGDDGRVYVVQNVVATGARNSISMCPGFPEGVKFSEIAVSAAHFVGLDQEGGVWCFGDNTRGQCGADPSIQAMLGGALRGGVKIAAGDYHTIVLDDNGEVWTWGDDTLLQLGHGDTRWAPSNASSKLPGESMKEKKPPSGTSASRPLVTYEPFETHLRFTPTKIADVPTDFDQQHTQEL